MTTYKGLRGLTIQTVAGDPSVLATGDIWYDNVARKIQGAKLAAGAWATGGNLTTARFAGAGVGTATAAIVFGGSPPNLAIAETYDGSSWTEVGDLNTGRARIGGAGATQTAALGFGGEVSPKQQN